MADRVMANLVLRRPLPQLDPAALERRLAALAGPDGVSPPQVVSPGWPLMLRGHGMLLTAMQVEAPLPGVDGLAAAAWWWPEAGAAIRGNAAHLLVFNMAPADTAGGSVAAARVVTRFAAALAAEAGPDALAVAWGASGTLWSAAAFVAQASEPLPVQLWMHLNLIRGARPGEVGVATRGLRPFLDRELRLEPTALLPPAEAAQRCYGLAAYLLSGAVVNDGDTVGISATESIRVRRAEDPALGGAVLSLTVEKPASGA